LDVAATVNLYTAAMREYVRHPIALEPTKAYSPASIGKAYLRAMGMRPVLKRQPDFPREVLGYAMAGYYGGRAETRIRCQPVPVVYVDFLSMYPTVCALLDLWSLLNHTRIRVDDGDPAKLQAWLNQLTPDHLFDKTTWPRIRALVQIQPNGEILPVRACYSGDRTFQIGVNHYSSREPQWYALPDVAAATLLTGRAPRVLRVLQLKPGRRPSRLHPITLRGEIEVDPARGDFFRTVIEQRALLTDKHSPLGEFLKTLANSTAYGIYAEMNRDEQAAGTPVEVWGLNHFTDPDVKNPERAGDFYFAPIACLIASAARLMLALLERSVTDRGGVHCFADTDSMAIVATHDGRPARYPKTARRGTPIKPLSWAQIEDIVERFRHLNPYDRAAIPGSILKIEDINYDDTGEHGQLHAYSISAKRYALFTLRRGEPTVQRIIDERPEDIDDHEPPPIELLDTKEHGLGHLVNPTDPDSDSHDWISQLWDYAVRVDALGLPAPEPPWLHQPAVTRTTITTPDLIAPFDNADRTRLAIERVRPFNFMLVAHVAPLGHPPGADPQRFQLVAPYTPNPKQWRKLAWTDRHTGQRYRITTTGTPTETTVRVKTYRDVLDEYRRHPEPKSMGSDGQVCGPVTVGLLQRRNIRPSTIHHIGKEANRLEDREAGFIQDLDETVAEYHDPAHDPFDTYASGMAAENRRTQLPGASGAALTAPISYPP
jgi:hypothetical protein